VVGDGGADLGSEFVGGCLVEAILEQQVIPANNGILDKAVAGLGDLLLLLVSGAEFTRVADGDRARESIAELDPVEQVILLVMLASAGAERRSLVAEQQIVFGLPAE
jgi:hypothetical protein